LTVLSGGSMELKEFTLKNFGRVAFKKEKKINQDEDVIFTVKNNL